MVRKISGRSRRRPLNVPLASARAGEWREAGRQMGRKNSVTTHTMQNLNLALEAQANELTLAGPARRRPQRTPASPPASGWRQLKGTFGPREPTRPAHESVKTGPLCACDEDCAQSCRHAPARAARRLASRPEPGAEPRLQMIMSSWRGPAPFRSSLVRARFGAKETRPVGPARRQARPAIGSHRTGLTSLGHKSIWRALEETTSRASRAASGQWPRAR